MRILDLNILPYRDAWTRQEAIHAEVVGGAEEAILLVEHPHTITLGRRAEASREHLRASTGELQRLNVELIESDRGGDITYHGPGQLVAYPIVRLLDRGLSVGAYMRLLQESVVAALATFHLTATIERTRPGVWVEDPSEQTPAKICAVGVRVRQGVTMHGLALNVEPDLSYFRLIDACGLGMPVTSLHHLLHNRAPSMQAVKVVLGRALSKRLG